LDERKGILPVKKTPFNTPYYQGSTSLTQVQLKMAINSFGAAGNCSQHPGLTPQATIVDNVPSAPVSTEIDTLRANGWSLLRTVVYFQKINWRRKS